MPGSASRRHARVPQNAERHEGRADCHEDARSNAAGEAPEPSREKDQKECARDAGQPGGRGCVADRSLHEERQVIEGDVERAVDHERRDVRHGEVARAKERQRDQGVRNPPHIEGERDRAEHADGERHVPQWILPIALLAVNGAEGEPADRQRHDRRPDPVEMPAGGFVAAFRHVDVGRPERDEDQRHVDEEGRPPGDRVNQQAADEGTEDGGGPRGAGPEAEGSALRFALEVSGEERQRSGHEDCPCDTLENPKEDKEFQVRRYAAEDRGRAEADQAPEEHPPPTEIVAERAGQDQQRAEGQQIGVVDVGLAFQDAEPESRQVPANAGQRDIDDCGVQEHDARPEHGGNQDPAAAITHRFLLGLESWPIVEPAS